MEYFFLWCSELIPFSFQSLVELTEGTRHVKCWYYNPSKPNTLKWSVIQSWVLKEYFILRCSSKWISKIQIPKNLFFENLENTFWDTQKNTDINMRDSCNIFDSCFMFAIVSCFLIFCTCKHRYFVSRCNFKVCLEHKNESIYFQRTLISMPGKWCKLRTHNFWGNFRKVPNAITSILCPPMSHKRHTA